MPKKEISVTPSFGQDKRLDAFLSDQIPELTRSFLKRLISNGNVSVNGVARKASYRLKTGDRIALVYEKVLSDHIEPQDISLEVVHEDPQLVVINKPSGMVVHPGAGVRSHTLVNALLFHFPDISGVGPEMRPGLVHRLDKETSGLLVIARTPEAYANLQNQFKARAVKKIYYGLIWGKMPRTEGTIDLPIGRHVKYGGRISVKTKKPKSAVTHYRVDRHFTEYTLLILEPHTGRTHQLRVHLASSGHPIVGDTRYGRRKGKKPSVRLFLHAHALSFVHPESGTPVQFWSPLPEDLQSFLASL